MRKHKLHLFGIAYSRAVPVLHPRFAANSTQPVLRACAVPSAREDPPDRGSGTANGVSRTVRFKGDHDDDGNTVDREHRSGKDGVVPHVW